MTNNEPEVVAWRWQKPVVNDQGEAIGVTPWELSDEPVFLPWWTNEPLIRLSDYQRLQAECEELKSYYKNGIECFANPCSEHSGDNTPPYHEFFERYGSRCLICEVDNYERLQAECEELRAELDAHKAARMAYASEFPLNADSDPAVGDIHQNIRALKVECEELRKDAERYQWIECNADVDMRGHCEGGEDNYGSLSDMIDVAMQKEQQK